MNWWFQDLVNFMQVQFFPSGSGPDGYPRVLDYSIFKSLPVPYPKNFTTRSSSRVVTICSFFAKTLKNSKITNENDQKTCIFFFVSPWRFRGCFRSCPWRWWGATSFSKQKRNVTKQQKGHFKISKTHVKIAEKPGKIERHACFKMGFPPRPLNTFVYLAWPINLSKTFTTLLAITRLLDFWVHYPTLPYPKLKNHYPSGPDWQTLGIRP